MRWNNAVIWLVQTSVDLICSVVASLWKSADLLPFALFCGKQLHPLQTSGCNQKKHCRILQVLIDMEHIENIECVPGLVDLRFGRT